MQVVTHFTFENSAEYSAFCKHMASFHHGAAAPKAMSEKEQVTETRIPANKGSDTDNDKPKQPEMETKAKVESKPAPAKTAAVPPIGERLDTEPSYENVKTAVLAVAQKYKSKAKSFEILKKFDIEKVTPDIPEEHFEGIIAACQKALDAAE